MKILAFLTAALPFAAIAQISYTGGVYTQDFNTLQSGTVYTRYTNFPAGWTINTTYNSGSYVWTPVTNGFSMAHELSWLRPRVCRHSCCHKLGPGYKCAGGVGQRVQRRGRDSGRATILSTETPVKKRSALSPFNSAFPSAALTFWPHPIIFGLSEPRWVRGNMPGRV